METAYGWVLMVIIGIVLNILRFVFGLPVNLDPFGKPCFIYLFTTGILLAIVGLVSLVTIPLAIFMGIGYSIEWLKKKKTSQ